MKIEEKKKRKNGYRYCGKIASNTADNRPQTADTSGLHNLYMTNLGINYNCVLCKNFSRHPFETFKSLILICSASWVPLFRIAVLYTLSRWQCVVNFIHLTNLSSNTDHLAVSSFKRPVVSLSYFSQFLIVCCTAPRLNR